MAINKSKRRSENLGRRKKTAFKKVYELGKYNGIDVALIIHQNGRFFTYRSINHESWPPSMKEIVRLYHLDIHIHTNVEAASLIPYHYQHASARYRKMASGLYRTEIHTALQIKIRKVDLDVDRNHLNNKYITSSELTCEYCQCGNI